MAILSDLPGTLHETDPDGALDLGWARRLNRDCACQMLDADHLARVLDAQSGCPGLAARMAQTHPHLFAATPAFVSAHHAQAMADLVAAVHEVTPQAAWADRALAQAPALARRDPGPQGVFMGFDFHIDAQGPQLIEINTNAGGALLNALLRDAQRVCCPQVRPWMEAGGTLAGLQAQWLAMFRTEWQRARGTAVLQRVVITDDEPASQYLYPEFQLAVQLMAQAGWQAEVADPQALRWDGQHLRLNGDVVDMVYNRLTDFYLEAPAHSALRQAYEADAVVLTPHPHAHALLAHKGLLPLLRRAGELPGLQLSPKAADTLARHIPRTEAVTPDQADRLWAERRHWFFKPVAGFGSRATYRGDKLTRRVWQEILADAYVAQALVAPETRCSPAEGADPLKMDVRAYSYAGHIQLLAARLYQGQTTNFRTPGGGFAPVYVV